MDIQKEREAFEQALVNQKNVSINNLHVCTIFDAEKNKYSPSDVCDPKEDFIVDWINSSWSIWQAAKAQADQKIKLLLCDEHLKKCESPTGVFNSQYPDEEPCLICLAKEAKAQAVPEGQILVNKGDYVELVRTNRERQKVVARLTEEVKILRDRKRYYKNKCKALEFGDD